MGAACRVSTCFVAASLLTVLWHSCESERDKLLVGDGHPRSLHLLIAASIAFSSTFYGRWLVNVCFVRSSRLLPGCETCDKYLRDGEQIQIKDIVILLVIRGVYNHYILFIVEEKIYVFMKSSYTQVFFYGIRSWMHIWSHTTRI